MDDSKAKRTIAKNTIALLVLRVVLPAFSVILVMFVARLLGTEGIGRYTLAYTFLYLFSTLAPLGINAIVARDGARTPTEVENLLAGALSVGLVSSAILTCVMGAVVITRGFDAETTRALLIACLVVIPATLSIQMEGAASAIERMELITFSAFVDNLLKTVGGVCALLMGYGLEVVLAMAVVGRIAGTGAIIFSLAHAGLRLRWRTDRETLGYLLKRAPTFLLITVFATLYWRIDIFMLSRMTSIEEVGLYGAAWRLLELGMVIPQSICLAAYPQLANAVVHNSERFEQLSKTTMRNLAIVSLPMALCATVLADPVLLLLYGPNFTPAASTLAVLIWTVVPYGWVRYNACILLATERQNVDLALNATMTGLNVLLNLVLIPKYGYFGAAIATTASIVLYGVGQYAYMLARLPAHAPALSIPAAVVIGSLAATLAAWLLSGTHVLFSVAGSVVIYAMALVAGGAVSISDVRALYLGTRIIR